MYMAKRHSLGSLRKVTKNHCTHTDFVGEGVVFLHDLEMVTKISLASITPQLGRRSGHRSLRVNRVGNGNLSLKFSASGTQEVYISTTDREMVIEALRQWSGNKGNCTFRVLDESG